MNATSASPALLDAASMPINVGMNENAAAQPFCQDTAHSWRDGCREIIQTLLAHTGAGNAENHSLLARSLDCFRSVPRLNDYFYRLPSLPICRLEGCSTPANAEALRLFLKDVAAAHPRFEGAGPNEETERPPSDAEALPSEQSSGDSEIDVVVQDFLLNDVPASRHEAAVREVGRVLKPGGLGLISFTSNEALDKSVAVSTDYLRARHRITWDPLADNLAELERSNPTVKSPKFLIGKLAYHPATYEFIHVAPNGRFQFFRSRQHMFALFEACGLRLVACDISIKADDHGLRCKSYRCLLVRQ